MHPLRGTKGDLTLASRISDQGLAVMPACVHKQGLLRRELAAGTDY